MEESTNVIPRSYPFASHREKNEKKTRSRRNKGELLYLNEGEVNETKRDGGTGYNRRRLRYSNVVDAALNFCTKIYYSP